MSVYLLKMKINGIKNITKEIELQFYNSVLTKIMDVSNTHIKSIYGANGAGKTAIIYAVDFYKELMTTKSALAFAQIDGGLKDFINQQSKEMMISFTFAVLDENVLQDVYEHKIIIKLDNEHFVISHESLKKLIGKRINNESFALIFENNDGKLKLGNFNNKEVIEENTKNLLREKPFVLTILHLLKDDINIDNQFKKHINNLINFFFELTPILQDSDTNRISFESLVSQVEIIKRNESTELFYKALNANKYVKKLSESVPKLYIESYEKYVILLTKFLSIFVENIERIRIDKEEYGENYECTLNLVYKDGRIINQQYESNGIRKLINLYAAFCAVEKGKIVFIDELDANIHDVLLNNLIEYFWYYTKGQLIFTTHNLQPMRILKSAKFAIDFLSTDSQILSWKKTGNYDPISLYRKGYIENSPFNIDPFSFLGSFGD